MIAVGLNNGVAIPVLKFGAFQVTDLAECERGVVDAMGTGYRLLNTAAACMSEQVVGTAIKESGIRWGDLFV